MDFVGVIWQVLKHLLQPVLPYLQPVVWTVWSYIEPVLRYLKWAVLLFVKFVFKFVELLVWPYLKRELYKLLPYEIRYARLAKDVNKLWELKYSVLHVAAEGKGAAIDDLIEWLEYVDRLIHEYDDFVKDKEYLRHAVCSDGYLPKPGIRYHASKEVNDFARRVHVAARDAWSWSWYRLGLDFGANFESRKKIVNDIMAALADENVGMIGVYGQSGVGKTVLAHHIASSAVEAKMFDKMLWINETGRLDDLRRTQGLLLDFVTMLSKMQSRGASSRELKVLIIVDHVEVKLDDSNMWGKDLIVNKAISWTIDKKILMISHSKEILLSHDMDGKGIKTFRVNPLTEKEAEMLFKTTAKIDDGNPLLETLAPQIVKMCKGLPLTVVKTAKALKNKKNLLAWKDAYEKLESQNSTSTNKLINDLQENEELKQTFLICACLGRDALITDLVRYCTGLGFLQGVHTVREARDRVHALVEKLKDLNLLSDSFSSDRFTMEDAIRDAALSIVSQKMHTFVVTKGKLDEWPEKAKLKRYSTIFLRHCNVTDIIKEFPERINCYKLKFFHLDNKDPRLEIPDNFFSGMKELRVLILIGIHLSSLPSSVKCLKKLRMLCLERCKLGEHLSIIGELETLRVLSLSGSHVECLPAEFKQLTKLQIFDISNCLKLEEIPADMLSSLTSLEELYVGNSPIQWKDEGGQGNQRGNASLSELRQLNQLTALDIQIPKITHFTNDLFFDKLCNYKIVISDFNAHTVWDFKMPETCEASRCLALQLEKGFDIHCQQEIKLLFQRVEILLLGQLNDVEDIFYELNCDGFPYLKHLSIVSNSKVKSIINSDNQNHVERAFPNLESLFLFEVNNMEHICCGLLTDDSFSKLKVIKLRSCGELKNVFFSSMIKHLFALETIEVSECNSLKEIVTSERESSFIDQIVFPRLLSLTLQSLSEFIGFTLGASIRDRVTNWKPNELFNQEVAIPRLERMELSSINIKNIWNDKSFTRIFFQNLMHLDVNDCLNLGYLMSISMSKSLMNLHSLFVSECAKMETIFVDTEASMIDTERESIFPKLKTINLRSMKSLRQIWNHQFPLRSFGTLDALIIEGCDKLESVFPSYMVAKFQSLCTLKVTDCKSMKEIFDLKGFEKRDAGDIHTILQNFHIEALPKLKHVWNKDPEGILKFQNLNNIWIQECHDLKHVFPFSIAHDDLYNLEYLEVWNCDQLKEIISREETENMSSVSFGFPKLTTARFSKLPNLESFYGGIHELHCPTLNNLSVDHCHKLKLFRTEIASPEMTRVFLPGMENNNLKTMQIGPTDAYYLKRYRLHRLEELQLSRLVDIEILYFLLHRNSNLKSILLSNCLFEQLVPPRRLINENSGVVPKLNSLKLMNLPSLKMIGFEEYTVLFRMLECLVLKQCPCLNTIAPSSVSFTYLTNLEVSNCNKLSCVMASSTAKSLVQLSTMKVFQCESMKTIVSDSDKKNKETIIFKQLKEIELDALHELESFCSSESCAFEFPSLEKVSVTACGKMKMFTSSEQFNKTQNLRQICVTHGKEEKICWEGDLNATIKHVCKIQALYTDRMTTSNPLEALESYRLKTLKLVNCELSLHAIPPAVFPILKSLEYLEVRGSDVEVIFGIKETEMKGYTFPLKKLILDNLPNLIQVWDTDREGVLSLQNLQEVLVTRCKKLKTLFPTELAERVKKLKKLEIRECEMFLGIVEEENAITDATKEFSFARLTSLNLHMLPQLNSFYPGRFTLECPELNHLEVLFCGNIFETFERQKEAQVSNSAEGPSILSQEEAIFILKSLKLDWKNTMMLCNGNFPRYMLHELVELELNFDDVNEVSDFPVQIFEEASNLECLQISRCRGLVELFLSQPEQGEIRMHGHSTTLYVVSLQKLCVSWCPHLITLVHSAVSFSNLKQLSVNNCQGLKYLLTSSTARMLVHLEEMYIVQCESMEQILARDMEEITSEAITFERLNTIVLDSLPRLLCFYSGSDTLLLSSLIKVLIWKCPSMKIFSQGDIHAESFVGIRVSLHPEEDLLFHQDLNTTVKMYWTTDAGNERDSKMEMIASWQ